MNQDPDQSPHTRPEVYLTAATPGTGGTIKQRPEDFIVEEVPLYDPQGTGEHIYLFVQKTGLSTSQLVAIIARHFGVKESAVGYAGLKDRHAVTRQVISVHTPGKSPEDFPMLRDPRINILWTDLHANKLRRGHLRANRFAIKVRDVPLRAVFDAKRALDTLASTGVPNRAGQQRFGFLANNHLVGRAIVLGHFDDALDIMLGPVDPAALAAAGAPTLSEPSRASRELYAAGKFADAALAINHAAQTERRALALLAKGALPAHVIADMDPLTRTFYLSAFQSAVFNRVLDDRLRAGSLATLQDGDVAFKHDGGAVFRVGPAELADPDTTARLASLAISPSGPLWGPIKPNSRAVFPTGTPGQAETQALAAFGVTPADLTAAADRLGDELRPTRRPLRVPLTFPSVEAGGDEHGHYIKCTFELPPGAFATVVMNEIMKRP